MHLYSILVVDDEAIIREGIKYLFDYEALGFSICGEAEDGTTALARIRALAPDVVLMDIRMPGLSGLDVVKKAREEGFSGRFVIVSSYSDFSYAQEAMRYGVQHYITKPIDEDELEQVLRSFRAELDEAKKASTASQHYRTKARSSILRDVFQGEADVSQLNLADLMLDGNDYQVVICDPFRHDSRDAENSFQALMCIPNPDYSAYERARLQGGLVYLLRGSAIDRLHHRIDVSNELEDLFLAVGSRVSTLEGIALSYRQAAQVRSRRYFWPEDTHVLSIEQINPSEALQTFVSNTNLQEYAGTLMDCIQSSNHKMLLRTLEELKSSLMTCSDTVDSVKLFLTALYLQIKNQMNHLYPNSDTAFSANGDIIGIIEKSTSLREVLHRLEQEFLASMHAIGAPNRDSVLDEILHYIHHNYAGNITLEDISLLFGYNRSYLGKIFSKRMGQNFNAYLDQLRIERSKELLLQDDSKVYTIAARVGYRNVDYFHIKFKKLTGISPAEYRRRNKKDE